MGKAISVLQLPLAQLNPCNICCPKVAMLLASYMPDMVYGVPLATGPGEGGADKEGAGWLVLQLETNLWLF